MFRMVMIAAWAVLLLLLLYLWADVREILGIVRDTKRELLRSNLSARAAESFPNFEQEAREEQEQQAQQETEKPVKSVVKNLNPQEEQVLKEVLSEFLG
ncbi:hypothetical protein ACTNCH_04310 [Candidatus Merdisoma sp. HCP28S3_D10]|uniref:hypothetical protein n=1 Tax=unclassified Candidatus Merdisoma TaxID=3099611 RepID=UPI003F89EDA5